MKQLTWTQADEIAAANGPIALGLATVPGVMVKYGVKENVARQIIADAHDVAVRSYRAALTDVGATTASDRQEAAGLARRAAVAESHAREVNAALAKGKR